MDFNHRISVLQTPALSTWLPGHCKIRDTFFLAANLPLIYLLRRVKKESNLRRAASYIFLLNVSLNLAGRDGFEPPSYKRTCIF